MKILVLDDEKLLRIALARVFTKLGHEVVCASTGDAAVREARRDPPPHLALVDVQLAGGENGVQVAKRFPKEVPVIFMSGVYDAAEIRAMNEGEAERVNAPLLIIGKPVDLTALERMIHVAAARPKP